MKRVLFFLCFLISGCHDNLTLNQIEFNKVEKITITIEGHINKPGTYLIDKGSTLNKLVLQAGGYQNNAQKITDYQLKDNEIIFINDKTTNKINLNQASTMDLQKVKGIGPSIASKILIYRKKYGVFKVVSQLKKIKGIKEKLFNKIYRYFTV